MKERPKTEVKFQLIRSTRRRIHHGLNGKSKSSSTLDILGTDVETYRKWIEYQMSPYMNWTNIKIYHVKRICMSNLFIYEELKQCFNWKILSRY